MSPIPDATACHLLIPLQGAEERKKNISDADMHWPSSTRQLPSAFPACLHTGGTCLSVQTTQATMRCGQKRDTRCCHQPNKQG